MPRKTTPKKHSAIPRKAPSTPATITIDPPKAEVTAASAAAVETMTAAIQTAECGCTGHSACETTQVAVKSEARPEAASFIDRLQDSDADTARDAALSLGTLGDASAVEPLITVLENQEGYFHPVVRAAAAASLAQLKDARAVDALTRTVCDPIAELSAEAVRSLAILGNPQAVETLIHVVRNTDGYFLPVVRRAAVIALAQLGGAEANAEVGKVATNALEDQVIRQTAQEAIENASK